jgi:transcriptional regulator with PAS, ATPase and Fis domain
MPLGTQAMLLRFIDQRQFKRVGGTENISVDLRIVTATNKRLDEEVQKERFREDLLYRLKVVSITMPPLRERGRDVPPLANHFLAEFAKKFKKPFTGVSPRPRSSSCATRGRATCASCATWSSASCCSRPGRRSGSSTCRRRSPRR